MKLFLSTLLGISIATACRTSPEPEAAADLAADRTDKRQSNNEFAFDMYSTLAKSSELASTNLFISPVSISTAFGMTYLGADGKTRDEMAKVLRISTDHDQAGMAFKTQLDDLQATKAENGYDLLIANKIWTASDIKFEADFSQSTKKYFRSQADTVDFKNAAARKKVIKDINQWASDNTNQRITNIVNEQFIRPEMSIVLANAVYFLGDWENPFPNSGRPLKMDWTRADKRKIQATMMSHEMTVKHTAGDNYQAVELPYRANQDEPARISMVLVLPKEGQSLQSLDRMLNESSWNEMTKEMETQRVNVTIPKWEVKGESIKLKDYLISMGMKSAWVAFNPRDSDGTANFSRMSANRSNVSLSQALHKTFVKVDEKGTEAAAVTVVGGVRATSIGRPALQFNANRPFLYAIRDMKTGQLLFIGRILDPSSAK